MIPCSQVLTFSAFLIRFKVFQFFYDIWLICTLKEICCHRWLISLKMRQKCNLQIQCVKNLNTPFLVSFLNIIQSNLPTNVNLGTPELWPFFTGCGCSEETCVQMGAKIVVVVSMWSLLNVIYYIQCVKKTSSQLLLNSWSHFKIIQPNLVNYYH